MICFGLLTSSAQSGPAHQPDTSPVQAYPRQTLARMRHAFYNAWSAQAPDHVASAARFCTSGPAPHLWAHSLARRLHASRMRHAFSSVWSASSMTTYAVLSPCALSATFRACIACSCLRAASGCNHGGLLQGRSLQAQKHTARRQHCRPAVRLPTGVEVNARRPCVHRVFAEWQRNSPP